MELKEKTIKNSFYSMSAQVIMILLRFLSRYFLIKYIGVELVGLSDTVSGTVGMLSLAEAGIGTSVSYSLYTPIHDNDQETINKIMNVFRKLYTILSGIIFAAGIFGVFFLKYILKGVEINETVYLIYFLYVGNTCISYLLCHRRTLLYADIREYVVKRVDIASNILFTFVGLLIIFGTHSIVLYTLTVLLQTFVSNVWIHVKSKNIYPYLKKDTIDKDVLKSTIGYSKDLFWGSVAGFVYGSTDNIIVSGFLGTIYVGYLGNYSLVSKSIQTIVSRILAPVTPSIGRLQRENNTKESFRNIFLKYHQICYVFGLVVTVPMLTLFDGFIEYAFGSKYLLQPSIKYLLIYVFYVNIAGFAYGNILTISGEFKLLKQVEMTGAIVNIGISLILVNVMGLSGVFAGTAIAVTIQWMIRSYMVYTNNLAYNRKAWIYSIIKEIYKILLVAAGYVCSLCLFNSLHMAFVAKFIICGCFSAVITVGIYLCLYRFCDRISVKYMLSLLKEGRFFRKC